MFIIGLKIIKNSPKTILPVLVGNNVHLSDRREVNSEEGQELADKNGMLFYEVSAEDGTNIENILYDSADKIELNIGKGYYDLESETCGIKRGANGIIKGSKINNYNRKKKSIKINKLLKFLNY